MKQRSARVASIFSCVESRSSSGNAEKPGRKKYLAAWLSPLLSSLLACSNSPPTLQETSVELKDSSIAALETPSNGSLKPKPSSALSSPALRLAMLEAQQAQATEAHRMLPSPHGFQATVRERQVSATFDERGASLRGLGANSPEGRLALASVGRAGGLRQPILPMKPTAKEHTVRWEHPVRGGALEERWQAGPLGLEHRVAIRNRPEGRGKVELEVVVEGLQAQEEGDKIALKGGGGGLWMSEYFVKDAKGNLLKGRMSVRGGKVVYDYEDEGATYPVEIDPLVFFVEYKFNATDKASDDDFGFSSSISADGNNMLISAPVTDDSGTTDNGSVYVFTRLGPSWAQLVKLLASDKASSDFFGYSVSLSADAKTAIVGAILEDDTSTTDNGAAYVFVKSGANWIQQAKLLASDKASTDRFGSSVAISADPSL